jgi:YesN/AraC family two-component response regulator
VSGERKYGFVVAEDEERMRSYLARKISEADPRFECRGEAADGEEAIELVERFLPDLLVTDIKMPVLGGLELVQRIRQTNPDMHVIIVSGFREFDYARQAMELGVAEYIPKPVDLRDLREALTRARIRIDASSLEVEGEFRLAEGDCGAQELVKAVRLYLQEHYRQGYSLERLAAGFGCKAAYLLRAFGKATGSTPTQELIKLRIEKAKRLLVGHPGLEIKQVAAAVGYDDPLYFSRLFKRETGSNPSAFREGRERG